MATASIVSIGNELLNGQTTDTNAAYLCGELLSHGIATRSCYLVGDEIEQIARALRRAAEDADIIITTGGLGPTDDDLTRQALAAFLNCDLMLQDDLLGHIKAFFETRGRTMPEKNSIQAMIPAGTKAMANDLGTAPGIAASHGGKLFFALPGPPLEMREMFERWVGPEIEGITSEQVVVTEKVRCFGAGESAIAELLGDMLQRGRNPLVNSTVSGGIITLTIVANAESKSSAEAMIEQTRDEICEKLRYLVFGFGEQTLGEAVGRLLTEAGKTLAVAESCTGGLGAKMLTDTPGSSKFFTHGWITYSNEAKISQLNVDEQLIAEHGAVSEEVAEAMASGARIAAGSDYAIGITGIAGPDGGTEQKPVGLVYISVCSTGGCTTGRYLFSHDRASIRARAAQTALNMLRRELWH